MPLPTCPHCGAPTRRATLVKCDFWHPYVCPRCARASRVAKPFMQDSLIVLTLAAILNGGQIMFSTPTHESFLLGFIAAWILSWPVSMLLASTFRLSPYLPNDAATG
jgi:hypothetical protein